jgi:hypothetical protein
MKMECRPVGRRTKKVWKISVSGRFGWKSEKRVTGNFAAAKAAAKKLHDDNILRHLSGLRIEIAQI